jgi:hypothetical protein
MKKILLSFSISAAFGVFAQKNARIYESNQLVLKDSKFENNSGTITEKNITTLWSDDFSNPATWTIDNNGQTGTTFGWNINSTKEGWAFNSSYPTFQGATSGGNNAELVNGNPTLSPATQALDVVYTMTTAAPIDIAALGGSNFVSLQFKQFGARFNDLQEIQISTDGTNFITVGDNLDKQVLSSAGGSAYPNPDIKTINLSTFLSANPNSVWIRFRWTTNSPGSADNPNVWITYGWFIDDVKIITNPDYDLSITSNYWGTAGLNYYQIPTTQVAPIDFSTSVFNGGLTPLTGAMLKAEVFSDANNIFTGMSPGTQVPSLDTASLDVSTSFTPAASIANYTLKRKIILGYLPNGQVLTGSLTSGGSGYSTTSGVAVSGGTGLGATLDITTSANGVVSTGTISAAGTGYADATGVATTGGAGTGLSLNIITNAGTGDIASATISAGGSGYLVGDVLSISGGNNNASFTVNAISGGTITGVVLNNAGTGYTAGDVLTIAGGSATYTIATVTNNTEITDELPSNNTIADLNFAVTNFTYARDNNTFAGSTSNGTNGFEVGNLYDIWADQTLNGLSIRLEGGTSGTPVGTEIYVKLYSVNPTTGDFEFVEESAPTIVAANNTNTIWTIPFLSPVNLNANTTYLAVVGSFNATLRVSNAGTSEEQTSFFLDLSDNTWYFTTSTPVVRMNFDPAVSLTENNVQAAYALAPNPTNSSSSLTINAKTSGEALVTITDMSGKQISVTNASVFIGENAINLATEKLTSGVYFVNVEFQGSTKSMKLIKK